MKNERVLVVDDDSVVLGAIERTIEVFGKRFGHMVIGRAQSLDETKRLMDGGLKPTVALVGNLREEGWQVAQLIRQYSR